MPLEYIMTAASHSAPWLRWEGRRPGALLHCWRVGPAAAVPGSQFGHQEQREQLARQACSPRGIHGPSHRRACMHDGTAAPEQPPTSQAQHHGSAAYSTLQQKHRRQRHNGGGPLPASSVASCVAAARPLRPAGGLLTATCGGAGRRGHLLRATQLCSPPHRGRAARRACWRSNLKKLTLACSLQHAGGHAATPTAPHRAELSQPRDPPTPEHTPP
jgi:hypothetical protein